MELISEYEIALRSIGLETQKDPRYAHLWTNENDVDQVFAEISGKANTTPTTTSVVKGIQQQASEKEKRVIQDDAEDASSNDQKSLPLTTALPELGTILENPNDDFDGERYLTRKKYKR